MVNWSNGGFGSGSPSSEVGMTLESSQARTADVGAAHRPAQEIVKAAAVNAEKTARRARVRVAEWSRQEDGIVATPDCAAHENANDSQ